jgi:hypothetical protein
MKYLCSSILFFVLSAGLVNGQTTTSSESITQYTQAKSKAFKLNEPDRIKAFRTIVSSGIAATDDQKADATVEIARIQSRDQYKDALATLERSLTGLPNASEVSKANLALTSFQIADAHHLTDRVHAITIEYLQATTDFDSEAAHTLLRAVLPANDSAQLFVNDDVNLLLAKLVADMRSATGRIDKTKLQAISDKLIDNKGSSYFVVTQAARDLAASMSGPHSDFLKEILTGDYTKASQSASTFDKSDPNQSTFVKQSLERCNRTKSQFYGDNLSQVPDLSSFDVPFNSTGITQSLAASQLLTAKPEVVASSLKQMNAAPEQVATIISGLDVSPDEVVKILISLQAYPNYVNTIVTLLEPKVSAATAGTISQILPTGEFDEVEYLKILGNTVDANVVLLDYLKKNYGIDYKDGRSAQALPQFFTALNVMNSGMELQDEEGVLKTAVTTPVQVIRFYSQSNSNVVNVTAQLVKYVQTTPNTKFILLCNDEVFRPAVAKILNNPNVIAIVLAPYLGADLPIENMDDAAQKVLSQRDFVRKVSDKPILLTVSYLYFNGDMTSRKEWAAAFGSRLADFDGFAIQNLATFGIFETGSRTVFCQRIGIPADKPCWVMDFVGTQKKSDHNMAVWDNKIQPFFNLLHSDGWRGIVVLSWGGPDDAGMKNSIIRGLPTDTQFSP